MVTENPSIFPLVRKIIFFLGMLCWLSSTKATTVYGLVTDEYKQPLPYANVYLKNTTQGATTNAEGVYALQLEPGSYEIIFSYVGFLQVTKQVQVGNKDLQLNVQLQPDRIELKEVVVTAGGEDPAYRVIREAIKKRKDYLEQIQSFRCKVYIKGVVRLDSTPRKFMGYNLEKKGIDSSTLGILYLSESESEYYFQQPGSVKEVMLSSRVSGDEKGSVGTKPVTLILTVTKTWWMPDLPAAAGLFRPLRKQPCCITATNCWAPFMKTISW